MYFYDVYGVTIKIDVKEGRYVESFYPNGKPKFKYEVVEGGTEHVTLYYSSGQKYLEGVWNRFGRLKSGTVYDRKDRKTFEGKLHHN